MYKEHSEFLKNGFIILKQQIPLSQARLLQVELMSIASDKNHRQRLVFRKNSGNFPERIEPLIDVSTSVRKISNTLSKHKLTTRVLGENSYLFKDKFILKPLGTEGYDWHRDYPHYPFCPADSLLTFAIPLDDMTEKNGAIQFFSASHKVPATEGKLNRADIHAIPSEQVSIAKANFGDLVVFHPNIAHKSDKNFTTSFRRVLFLTYNSMDCGQLYEKQLNQSKSHWNAKV